MRRFGRNPRTVYPIARDECDVRPRPPKVLRARSTTAMKPFWQILPGLLVLAVAFLGIIAVSLGPAARGHSEDSFPEFFPTPAAPTPTPGVPPLRRAIVVGAVAGDQGRLTSLPGAGCAGTVRPGGEAALSLVSAGRIRAFRVHMPATARPDVALPVILDFHALAATAAIEEQLSGLLPLSDREGFLLVSPEGTGSPTGWNALLSGDPTVDDVRFTEDLIGYVTRNFCVDAKRIYATGFSNGGMLASRLACRLGDRIAAVVPVAGVYRPGEECSRLAPIMAIHGTLDDVVPFNGGTIIGIVPYEGPRMILKEWALQDSRCIDLIDITTMGPGVTLEAYRGCGREEVQLLVIEGLGHAPPPQGTTPEIIWSFMKRHRLP